MGIRRFVFAALLIVPVVLSAQQPLVVRKLSFNGNRAIPEDTLRAAISTSESETRTFVVINVPGLGEKRYFDETEFRRDVIRLTVLYRQSGYPDARVDTVVRRTSEDVRVDFNITEGQPVRVTRLTVVGTEPAMVDSRVVRVLPIQVGDVFNRNRWQAAADTIRGLLQDRGYPFAQVYRNFDLDRQHRTATVEFVAVPGALARIGTIDVQGTSAIDPDVVRRILAVHPGEPFSARGLYDSQRDLYRLGLFNFVTIGLADTTGTGADTLVTIIVRVAEGALERLRMGAGWGSIDCFRAQAGWTGRNFLGGARSLDLNARVSKIGTGAPFPLGLQHTFVCQELGNEQDTTRLELNYNLSGTLRQPFVFGRNNSLAFTLSAQRTSELQAFVREAVGAEIALTQQTSWQIPITLSYQISYGRTVAAPAIFCSLLNQCGVQDTVFSQRRLQSTIGLSAIRDRSDSPLDPTDGSIMTANLRYAGRITASDTLSQFAKGVLDVAVYRSLSQRTVIAWRLRIGSIISPTLGNVGDFVPPQERFYGGGPSSVRGFGQNELGPVVRVIGDSVDTNGDGARDAPGDTLVAPTGGNQLIFANVELRFPLPIAPERFRAAIFLDVGQVFQRSSELVSLQGIRATPGAGIRIITPLGPLRLDVAYNGYAPEAGPLYRQVGQQLQEVAAAYAPDAPSGFLHHLRVHVSVGQAF